MLTMISTIPEILKLFCAGLYWTFKNGKDTVFPARNFSLTFYSRLWDFFTASFWNMSVYS
jgi:hypothetical protein